MSSKRSRNSRIEKKQQSNHVLKVSFDILIVVVTHNTFTQTEHTYARLTFVVRLVDNAFLSKYC